MKKITTNENAAANAARRKTGYNRMILRLLAACVVICLLIGVIPFAAAAEESEPKTIKVGYYENEIFEEGASDGAVKKGYAYEYYSKLSEYTGWKYEYVYGTFAELYQELIDGKIDLLAGLALKEERLGLIGYPDIAMGSESLTLVKHKSDEDITAEPSTLNGRTIGVLNSAIYDTLKNYLSDHSIEANVTTFDDYDQLFKAFDSKQVDILAAEGDGAYNRDDAEVLFPFGSSDYYLCANIRRLDLLDELNSAQYLLSIEEPHYIVSLKNKYYPVSVSRYAFTKTEKEWMASHDSLTVGYLEHYLPYSDIDDDGNATGLVKDIVPLILEKLGISDKIELSYRGYKSYDDMIAGMNNDEIDVAFPIGGSLYYSEEKGIYQSSPVVTSMSGLVYSGEYNEEKTTSRFAVNKNNSMQYNNVIQNYPDAEIVFFDSNEECLDALLAGRATCTMINGLRAYSLLRNSTYDTLSFRQLSISEDCCFGVKIGNEGLLKLLNRGMNIVGTEYAQDLAYRYTSGLYKFTLLDMLREHMILFSSLILLLAAMVILFFVRDAQRKKKELSATETARIELEEKNAELARSKEALSDALIAAEHANRAKTTFLNSMSHDIRTPMNAIVGFTAMAAANIDNKERVQDYLGKISVSSRHLLSLINDVLDMSRIESGNMKIEEAEVHLPDVIHDLRTIIQANVKAKNQDLFIDTQDVKNEDIITDKLRLNQVLLNILTNAVKFTPAGGMVSFRVIEKPSDTPGRTEFEFHIKDNGIGMSEEFQKTIFEAFTRERNSTVSGIQGTGLGMAITKNIVDLMGGTISVTSEKGKGSEFIVNIPCSISANPTDYSQVPELVGLRALVADDDTNTCLSVCSMLRDIGMRPDWTNYGKEAVIRAKEAYDQSDKFRVYIIDWMMPDMNGIETVRRIRKVIGDSDPIIIMTAYDWSDIEAEAIEAGVTGFCSKPLFMSELRNVLAKPFRIKKDEPKEEEKVHDFSGKRVLLAEDNEMNQMIAVSILEGAGFETEIADDGQKAVDMVTAADAGYYDIILMDIQMPVMDGYEAARQIRRLSDPEKANILIIAVTANAFEEDRKIALEAGMNGYLAKPYDIPVMIDTLETQLKNHNSGNTE